MDHRDYIPGAGGNPSLGGCHHDHGPFAHNPALEGALRRLDAVGIDVLAHLHNLHLLLAQAADDVHKLLKHHTR